MVVSVSMTKAGVSMAANWIGLFSCTKLMLKSQTKLVNMSRLFLKAAKSLTTLTPTPKNGSLARVSLTEALALLQAVAQAEARVARSILVARSQAKRAISLLPARKDTTPQRSPV